MTRTYTVKEVFSTIQGEGFHVGTPALFVRFAGCNMWSGLEEHRDRDAIRNEARCPRWCDTDFVGGEKYDAKSLAFAIQKELMPGVTHVVLTGGEPLLQVDQYLLHWILMASPQLRHVAIETNGTVAPDFDYTSPARDSRIWITMSPKRSRLDVKLARADEVKVVMPDYAPDAWRDFPADHYFVQARADRKVRSEDVERDVVTFVGNQGEPGRWRLSLQTHKIVGIP